jgi:hypothetical protein
MKKRSRDGVHPASLDELIVEVTAEAGGDEERFRAFQQACQSNLALPCEAFVIGEPVSLIGFDYDGNQRRGLTASCRRADGGQYVVAASEVVISPRAEGARYLGAYRKWMGLEPFAPETPAPVRGRPRRQVAAAALDLRGPVELAVLSLKQKAARCRLLDADREITLRATRLWVVVPGEIAVVKPRKQWSYAGHPYLSGEIESTRLEVAALGLTPLRLEDRGMWDPSDHYWGEKGERIEKWAKPIIARGPRPQFEMEQVLPGEDPEDPFSDPITESNELRDSGDGEGAYKILMDACQADLRCLDAHVHLGNFSFDHMPKEAMRHYEVGLRIGELSLGEGFDGVLPWGMIDNRPFLRSMHNFGLCLWRLGRFEETERIFGRMLWLNPSDNQGVRFLIGKVRARAAWEDSEEE